jgi:hypothetical protein
VEAEFFGGVGTQAAAVWEGGRLVFGPVIMEEAEPVPVAGTPISQALARHDHDHEGFVALSLAV